MTADEVAVLSANEAFYDAFAARDYEEMDELWASEREVTCIHPGWTTLIGRARVMASWRAILGSEGLPIEATGAHATIVGEAAYVVCFEGPRGEGPILAATNIFVREGGDWKLIHHQAGQLAMTPEPVASGPTN